MNTVYRKTPTLHSMYRQEYLKMTASKKPGTDNSEWKQHDSTKAQYAGSHGDDSTQAQYARVVMMTTVRRHSTQVVTVTTVYAGAVRRRSTQVVMMTTVRMSSRQRTSL